MEVTFETAFLLDGVPVGVVHGVPEHEPHLDNPAVHVEFGDARADVTWNGARLAIDVATSLDALAGSYPLDAAGSPVSLVGSASNGR